MGQRSSLQTREYYRKIKKENQALISAIVGLMYGHMQMLLYWEEP